MPVRASWRGVYLAEPSGRIVFTSDKPFGTDHGRLRDGLALERIRSTLRPTVTDLVRVAASGELVTGVQIPVILGGRLEYVLGARIAASHWQALAERTSAPPAVRCCSRTAAGGWSLTAWSPAASGTSPAEDAGAASPERERGALAGMLALPSFSHRRAIDAGGTGWAARADVPAATLAGSQATALLSVAAAGALSSSRARARHGDRAPGDAALAPAGPGRSGLPARRGARDRGVGERPEGSRRAG